MRSLAAFALILPIVAATACDDAVSTMRELLARTLSESSHSSRRAALAASQDLPPVEQHREKLAQFSTCARGLRQDIDDSWRAFQAASIHDAPGQDVAAEVSLAGLEQCIRGEIEVAQTSPRFTNLEESLRAAIEAAETYEGALRRYTSLAANSGSVESLAPERNALAAALESTYIGWSVSIANLEKHIAERRKEVDRLELEQIAERAGKRAEYHVQAVQFAVVSARECVATRHTVHGCLESMEGVSTAITAIQAFLQEHEAAIHTVFWLPIYRDEVARLGQATDRLIERTRTGADPNDALATWLKRSDILRRQAQHLRFDQPHPASPERSLPTARP